MNSSLISFLFPTYSYTIPDHTIKIKLKKVIKFINNKDYRFLVLAGRGLKAKVPDEEFLKRMYKIKIGEELNLNSPEAYTEKLQWLKLYDHKPIYTKMVD